MHTREKARSDFDPCLACVWSGWCPKLKRFARPGPGCPEVFRTEGAYGRRGLQGATRCLPLDLQMIYTGSGAPAV